MNKFERSASRTTSHSTLLSNNGNLVALNSPLMWLMTLLLSAFMVGCGGGGGSGGSASSSNAKAITLYSVNWTTGTPGSATGIISGTAIAVTVPNGTSLTDMVATFTTTGTSVKVGGTDGTIQVSGTTSNNFSAPPVAYTVIAADGSSVVYNVTVTVAAADSVFPGVAGTSGANVTNPTVISANPSNLSTNIPTSTNSWDTATTSNIVSGTQVNATFNEAMNSAAIISPATTFTLKETINGTNVPGTVTMTSSTIARFTPDAAALSANTSYTATITTAATSVAGSIAMPMKVVWSFTTNDTTLTGQTPVNLLTAGDFAILANTAAIAYNGTAGASAVIGDVGLATLSSASFTGFSNYAAAGTFATVTEVVTPGKLYASDFAVPTPAKMTLAGTDMTLAYNDGAGRTAGTGVFLNPGASGDIVGLTLAPGVYTFGSNVTLSGAVTLSGGPDDVWIFQIAGYFRPGISSDMILSNPLGGALPQAKNIFWVVAGSDATLGGSAHLEGVILTGTGYITLNSSATVNGRLLAHTAITSGGTVTQPAP